ncbi:MAG: sodium-dependent transporter [Bacteroidota bacterium]
MASRSGFSSRIGFVAAAAGSAVGLGNIWKFPYETGENGGAAFLLIYLACTILIGFPVMVGEIALGRQAQANPYGAYTKVGDKNWGLIGLLGILAAVMILSFYNVVAGWAFGYFVQITFGDLLVQEDFSAYFGNYVANIQDNLIYSLVFMAITAVIVVRGIQGGIEAASKLLMPLLYVILFGLIGYALTLENAGEGVAFYLIPDFRKLNYGTVYSAMGQAFFSLSLGLGALITYGSYISKKENVVSAAAIVTLADVSVAFLAGLLIFPLVFSQGQTPSTGPGLVFVALPGIFQGIGGIGGKLIGGGFFLLLAVAALTSTISLLEVPVSYFVDERKWPRKRTVWVMAGAIFLLGIPSMLSLGASDFFTNFVYYEGTDKSFFDLIDDVFNNIGLPLGGFLLTLFIAFRWKTHNMSKELELGFPGYLNSLAGKYINFVIVTVCPFVLGTIFLLTVLQKFFGVLEFG